jgi:hypothetical protein
VCGRWVSWEAEVIFRLAEPAAVAVSRGGRGGAADCRSRPHHPSTHGKKLGLGPVAKQFWATYGACRWRRKGFQFRLVPWV